MAAALSAREGGAESVLILERDERLGGILNQCIHNGFGLHTFQEELTGPEYADRFASRVLADPGIDVMMNTMVLDIAPERIITAVNSSEGLFTIDAGAVILAMGCRERPRGALNIPGYRPAGIYSAGCAQHLVNIEGVLPGKEVVILGSGDIGLIMARRMTLEGAKVHVVAELMPYSGGLKRNIVQCLDDFGIPLKLSHTVVNIRGKERVEGVTLAEVDVNGKPVPGTEEEYSCDTLLLSCGLIPENELSETAGVLLNPVTSGPVVNESFCTNVEGIFACGNVLHVHDLVDYVTEEAAAAGRCAAAYIRAEAENTACEADPSASVDTASAGNAPEGRQLRLVPAGAVRYTIPNTVCPERLGDSLLVRFRVGRVIRDAYVSAETGGENILRKKKRIVTPGEMQEIVIKKEMLLRYPDAEEIIIRAEEQNTEETAVRENDKITGGAR